MRLIYNTIVIGAGASGLFCAKSLTEMKIDTLVLEKMDRPGLKLLITGGGMCNITRDEPSYEMLKHYGDKGHFLGSAFSNLPPEEVIKSFKKKGVDTFAREDHKVFPQSKKAIDVLYSLCDESYPIIFNICVEKIIKDEDNFIINDTYKAKHIVIATGGVTYPLTGSTGDGYAIASSLGHKIINAKPSLTQIKIVSEDLSDIEGISLANVTVSVPKSKGKKYHELTGDFLFTRLGITGPVILDSSRYCESGMLIKINLNERVEPSGANIKLSNLIKKETSLPSRFIDYILKSESIEDIEASQTKKVNWQRLNNKLSNWVMEISLKGTNKIGMSTEGGVTTKEIDSKTFESKICENLYFTGEVMDYSGDCGGYNLQACWSTAYSVAKAISEKGI
ncbi:MAG: aminoacetone oxidase family FAD-binding enzyme [Spirochaetaceae bacterium]|nr:aminoacetone oxidase family FAD-binding enzyme [Spirochaetaceae bacterium]